MARRVSVRLAPAERERDCGCSRGRASKVDLAKCHRHCRRRRRNHSRRIADHKVEVISRIVEQILAKELSMLVSLGVSRFLKVLGAVGMKRTRNDRGDLSFSHQKVTLVSELGK